jgi:hypothetical protein
MLLHQDDLWMFFVVNQAHKIKPTPKLSHNKLTSTQAIIETEASDNKKREQHVIGSKQAGHRDVLLPRPHLIW